MPNKNPHNTFNCHGDARSAHNTKVLVDKSPSPRHTGDKSSIPETL